MASYPRILPSNPGQNVKPLRIKQTQRDFLSLAELQALAKADCDIPEMKRAGLLSDLSGLRYGDVEKLTWDEVCDDASGSYLRFTQGEKTKGAETMPLSAQARPLLGERTRDVERVFPHLLYSSHQNHKLQQCVTRVGIGR